MAVNILPHYLSTHRRAYFFSFIQIVYFCIFIQETTLWGKNAIIQNSNILTRQKPNCLFYDPLNYSCNNVNNATHYSSIVASVLSCWPDVCLPDQTNKCRSSLLDDISRLSWWNGQMNDHRSALTTLTSAPVRAAVQRHCRQLFPSPWPAADNGRSQPVARPMAWIQMLGCTAGHGINAL